MRRGLALLVLAAAALPQEADYGAEALRARVEALLPDVEAALGAPLGDPVEVVVATPEALRDLLAKELVAERAQIAGGPRGEELERACGAEAALASLILLAKVDLQRGSIHVCADNFGRIAALDPAWKDLKSPEALDAVLLHEMVHVFQVRRFDLLRFIGAPSSMEQLMARSAVVEGHAQHVGRQAAKRRGLDDAFAMIDRAQTTVPASIEDPAMRHLSEVVGANLAFAYVDGERFVAAIVAKLGYEKAVERLFANPPATIRAVSRPAEYLEPPAPDTSLDGITSRVQRLLVERGGTATVMPLALPTLRAALAPAGARIAEAAMRSYEKGIAIVRPGDPQITVGILYGRDEEAGRVLYDAELATSRAKDDLFGKPGAQIRIVSATYRSLPAEEAEGTEASKTVEIGGDARQRVESAVLRRRAIVIEVMVVNPGAATGQAARLAREVLELLRGDEAADPWDGKKGDDARRALVGALDDPRWGVRWRATRNLARLPESAEIEAALARMTRDPDPSVSCDALRGLVRRGWLTRAEPQDLHALAAHADWEVRLAYERAAAEHEADEEARTLRLLTALEDAHPAIRTYAFDKLDDLGEYDRIPWELSRAGIEDPDDDVRLAAIRALGLRNPPEARGVLLKALGDGNPRIRRAAAFHLRQWAKESPPVVDALIRALGDESSIVRSTATRELGDAGKVAAAAVPAIVRLLDDESVREEAAESLGEIGIADPEAMRKLEGLLKDGDLSFRFEVARALRRLGRDPGDLAAVFAETLRKGKEWERDNAARDLGLLGEAARPHVADLVGALKEKEIDVREAAAEALGNLGAIAEEALPALTALGGEEEEEEFERDEDGNPVIGLGGAPNEADVRRAAREAAKKIRAALAK